MKLFEILQEKPEPGTYAGVHFSDATKDAIVKYIEENNIPNGTPKHKLHCTVLYSRKHCPNYKAMGDIDPPWIGEPSKLEVWETNGKLRNEPTKRCLVLKFDCPKLVERHKELMKTHKATYDFPEYKTHVTLSYDIGDLDEATLPSVRGTIDKIEIVHEYQEDLDLDWADKHAKK